MKIKRFLAAFLVLCMIFSVVPFGVFAAGTESAANGGFMKIAFLDCGRKYFTPDWIIAMIKEAKADGYTHVQLGVGNDGLRFLLDDMSFQANGQTYSHDAVTAGIKAGNKAYHDCGAVNELSQADMDRIIAAAKQEGIEIIPLINTPGHMDAILHAMQSMGVNGSYCNSVRTVDVANAEGVAFTQALVQKYMNYFRSKGCKYFNIGADEYANDVFTTGGMGFAHLEFRDQYGKFVEYLNSMIALVKKAGMTPMAFNDGVYYNHNMQYPIDRDLVVCYWSAGWSGYNLAPASFLAQQGFRMVNTNGDFYYVLGKNDTFDHGFSSASRFRRTSFSGSTVSNPAGAMFCIWCDYPAAETEQIVAQKVRLPLRAMGDAMDEQYQDNMDQSVVAGGFNVDGTINGSEVPPVEPTEPKPTEPKPTEPEPTAPVEETHQDPASGVTLTAPGLKEIQVTEVAAPEISDAKKVLAWDMTLTTAEGTYTDAAVVRISVPAEWDPSNVFAFVVNKDGSVTTIEGAYADGAYTYTCPHFSVTGIAERVSTALADTITEENLPGGYVKQTGKVEDNAEYLIVYQGKAMSYTGKKFGSVAVTENKDGTLTTKDDVTKAIWTRKNNGFRNNDSKKYLYLKADPFSASLDVSNKAQKVTVNNGTDGNYKLSGEKNIFKETPYLSYNWGTWGCKLGSDTNVHLYKFVADQSGFKVDPALQADRINSLTVANDNYTQDSWNAYETALKAANEQLKTVTNTGYQTEAEAQKALNDLIDAVDTLQQRKKELKKVEYIDITINYRADDVTVKTETRKVEKGSTSVTLETPITGKNGKPYALNDTKLILIPDTLIYDVSVTEVKEDLSKVNPFKIEYWITNGKVVDSANQKNAYSVMASSAYSENGLEVTSFIPRSGYKETAQNVNDPQVKYWRCRLLDRQNHVQTEKDGDDETLNGVTFTKIRYWNQEWAVYTERNEWVSVTAKNHQLVAYYMNDMNLTDEVQVGTSDWGKKGDGTLANEYLESDHVSLSFQVVYEDNTTAPATVAAKDLAAYTYLVNNWNPRGVGTIGITQIGDFQIWKVTAETGTHQTDYTDAYAPVHVTNFKWDQNEKVVYEGEPVSEYTISNNAQNPSMEGAYGNLTWDKKHEAILIRIYVKTVKTEDSLTVHYIDKTADKEFYNYNISVASGTVFDEKFALDPNYTDPNKALSYNTVENSQGRTQTVKADLSQMTEIGAQYRYSSYKCVEAVRSSDGKSVSLYYTFNNAHHFVTDFGLPLKITADDLKVTPGLQANVTDAKYGDVQVDEKTSSITYTPNQVLPAAEALHLDLTENGQNTVTHYIYIHPASNVMYEENFMTPEDGSWSHAGSVDGTNLNIHDSIYGYADAYKTSTEDSGYYQATVKPGTADKRYSGNLNFTFTGTGFDLIASCGPTTGNLVVQLTDANNKHVMGYVVDTSFMDAQYGEIHQVPVIHDTGLEYGTYHVVIRGAYMPRTATRSNGPATYAAAPAGGNGAAEIYDMLIDMGFTDDQIVDFQFINMNQGNAATYSVQSERQAGVSAAPAADGPQTLKVDGFRVYRPSNNKQFIAAEQNVNYINVLDCVNGDKLAAYIEPSKNVDQGSYAVSQYEALGGPQNEIYLKKGQSVAFRLSGNPTTAQISARAVAGTAKLNGTELQHNTEMYYNVEVKGGIVTIVNDGDGLLALGNLKTQGTPVQMTEADQAVAIAMVERLMNPEQPVEPTEPSVPVEPTEPSEPSVPVEPTEPSEPSVPVEPTEPSEPSVPVEPTEPEEPEEDVFAPKDFRVNVSCKKFFGKKYVDLTVRTSKDVAYITVNGERVSPDWFHGWFSNSRKFEFSDRVPVKQQVTYEIVAYSADGRASEAKIIKR